MRWTTKARIQSYVGRLPNRVSRPVYYGLQRHFGNLRRGRINPTSRLIFGMEFCRHIVASGRSPRRADFVEVGTGWRLNTPIALWLCGARSVLTLDLNPYLRFALIKEDLKYLREHQHELLPRLRSEYGKLVDAMRWQRLLEHGPTDVASLCEMCGITYQSPADARHTSRPANSIDFHISCNVFEHIPRNDLQAILQEANRITKPTGLLLHRVDHTDHFSHSDSTLSPIHFLQFTDDQWRRYAGDRYAYVNRLREGDYASLFAELGQQVREVHSQPDAAVKESLRKGFSVDARFRDKAPDELARLTSLFIVAPSSAESLTSEAA